MIANAQVGHTIQVRQWVRQYAAAAPRLPREFARQRSFPDDTASFFLVGLLPGAQDESPFTVVRPFSEDVAIVYLKEPSDWSFYFSWMAPANDDWKWAPGTTRQRMPADRENTFILVVRDPGAFRHWLQARALPVEITGGHTGAGIIRVRTTARIVRSQLLHCPWVTFIDLRREEAREEMPVNGLDLGPNRVNTVHAAFPWLNGEGLTASLKENAFDTTDADFRGRYLFSSLASNRFSVHANIMATILGGGGNTHATGKGAAWKSRLSSSSFDVILPDSREAYEDLGISVQNHSYGVGIESYYGAEAAAFDASTFQQAELLHVFSAGNEGTGAAANGPYAGLAGFANLTGNFKMAKNIINVGAIDSTGQVQAGSSRGPAFDGRLKPELVAYGRDGSSGAAALVSGTALLLQQAYRDTHGGTLPPAALVRAVLLNSADDAGPPGIDYQSGYGNINAYRSVQTVLQGRFTEGRITTGGARQFSIMVPEEARNLRVTLAWTDPPAQANAARALVNDLDLSLQASPTGTSWQPWVLPTFPHPDSLRLPARRGRDTLNNAEQITLAAPDAGLYEIIVRAAAMNTPDQDFYLAYWWDEELDFEWTAPTATDPVEAGKPYVLRWQTTLSQEPAQLAYSLDAGASWTTITDVPDPGRERFRWNVPDTLAPALLRLNTAGGAFLSDTFVISRAVDLHLGFNCPDSLLLFWNAAPPATAYRLSTLRGNYLEPVATLRDSFALLSKTQFPGDYFAIAPLTIDGRAAMNSYTLFLPTQSVGCYFQHFLADLDPDGQIILRLRIGTSYQVQQVTFEKRLNGKFVPLQAFLPENHQTDFTHTDPKPVAGVNTYRARLDLSGGRTLFSEPVDVYLLDTRSNGMVFPNPVATSGQIRILFEADEDPFFHLYNAYGQCLRRELLTDSPAVLNLGELPPGVYPYALFSGMKIIHHGALMVGR